MAEWVMKKLKDIANFNPRESLAKGVVAKKVAMDKLQPFCRDIPGYELEPFSGGTKFRNGDTIMARITPCLENGKTAKVAVLDDGEVGFGSTEYIVFRAKDGIDEDFIYYLVCSPLVREPAIKSMVGSSGRQRVQADVVQNLEIMVPDYEEQKRISGILKSLDDKIAANTEVNKNLEQLVDGKFQELFGGLNFNATLSDVAEITMGQSPAGSSYNEEGAGIIFYQGRGEFGWRFPKRRLYTTEPKRLACEGDVLMSVRAPVGDLNVAFENCCIGRGLAAIHSETPSFALYLMRFLKPQLEAYNGEGTVFGSINGKALKSLEVALPSHNEVMQFESFAAPIDALIRSNENETRKLNNLRNYLLPKLMSGEIDVSKVDLTQLTNNHLAGRMHWSTVIRVRAIHAVHSRQSQIPAYESVPRVLHSHATPP